VRFNQVFYLLLLLSAVSAFLLPQGVTDRLRPAAGVVLWPVARPSRSIAGWATGRTGPGVPADTRPADVIVSENLDLKHTVARLQYELDEFRKRDAEYAKLGPLRDLCRPVPVIGVESERDVLTIGGSSLSGLADRMPVLHDRYIVGALQNVGLGGAQVMLLTDPRSRVRAHFASFRKVGGRAAAPADAGGEAAAMQFVRLDLPVKLVEGAGNGRMICRNIPAPEIAKAGLAEGDWAVLDEPEWPGPVQGRRLGVIRKIVTGNKLMAEIEIRPDIDLKALKEVMVLVKDR